MGIQTALSLIAPVGVSLFGGLNSCFQLVLNFCCLIV